VWSGLHCTERILIDIRVKQNHYHIHLDHPDKSATVRHSNNVVYCIQLQNTSILCRKCRYTDHIMRKVNELYPNNINMQNGFCLRDFWKPLLYSLKAHKKQDCPTGC
jgi:hypothetical protein